MLFKSTYIETLSYFRNMKAIFLFFLLITGQIIRAQSPHDTLYSPDVTRLTNYSNGSRILELTGASRQYIATNYFMQHPVYKGHSSQIQVSVYDWDSIIPGDYRLDLDTNSFVANWKMYRIGTTDTVYSNTDISQLNHQFIPHWGLVVTIYQDSSYYLDFPNYAHPDTSYFDYSQTNCNWVSGMEDIDGDANQDWILSGTELITMNHYDTAEVFEKILNSRFTCGRTTNTSQVTSMWDSAYSSVRSMIQTRDMHSLDLVLTADTSLWSRAVVVNSSHANNGIVQEILPFPSLNKSGLPDNSGTTGLSWFPGYAINVETGERLNIAFSEDTTLINHNGNDGIFNPDSVRYENGNPVFGGRHWIYIFQNQDRLYPGQNRMPLYDESAYGLAMLNSTTSDKIKFWRSTSWVGSVMPAQGFDLLQCDVTLKIRQLVPFHFSRLTALFDSTGSYLVQIPSVMPNSVSEINFYDFNIFPNPSENGLFNYSTQAKINSIKVFDAIGKLIYQDKNPLSQGEINLSSFDSGIYIIQFSDKNNQIVNLKVILQR